ncbi:PREDICTED: uncharacterized protein LOC103329722 [Prunus mume]|uniref:Uncharacterized protein LOC103329722 n=1 Tax=Prunus mume TaxID=102107 RepID=A0ABM0NVG3_PRUMU|nr:PREDICTED: uncharacterized protein LOC103329722 [Prunus mume]
MDESNIQRKSLPVENSCSLITKLNHSVCTNTSSYEETSPENCSVDHEADLKHSREDYGGSNHSAKVWPANGCTGERGTGRSAKKPHKGRTAKEEASKHGKVREIQKRLSSML